MLNVFNGMRIYDVSIFGDLHDHFDIPGALQIIEESWPEQLTLNSSYPSPGYHKFARHIGAKPSI